MNSHRNIAVGILAGALLLCAWSASTSEAKKPPPPPPRPPEPVYYDVHWFQAPGEEFTRPYDVNSSGVAVGFTRIGGFAYFLDKEGQRFYFLEEIAEPGWEGWYFRNGRRINDADADGRSLVTGSVVDPLEAERVFLGELVMSADGPILENIDLIPLDPETYPTQSPIDLSDNGIVTGVVRDGSGQAVGFVASCSHVFRLGDYAYTGINPQGTVAVGESHTGEVLRYDLDSMAVTSLTRKNKAAGGIDILSDGVIMATLDDSPGWNLHRYTANEGWQVVPGADSAELTDTNNVGHTIGRTSLRKLPGTGFAFFGSVTDPQQGYWLLTELVVDDGQFAAQQVVVEGMSDAAESGYPLVSGYGSSGAFILIPYLPAAP